MEQRERVYWGTTALFCLAFAGGGFNHLLHTQYMTENMTQLGYPAYVMTILGVAKLLGVIALAVPARPFLKEWAYELSQAQGLAWVPGLGPRPGPRPVPKERAQGPARGSGPKVLCFKILKSQCFQFQAHSCSGGNSGKTLHLESKILQMSCTDIKTP